MGHNLQTSKLAPWCGGLGTVWRQNLVTCQTHFMQRGAGRIEPRANRCNPVLEEMDNAFPRPCLHIQFLKDGARPHDSPPWLKPSRHCFINASHTRSLPEVQTISNKLHASSLTWTCCFSHPLINSCISFRFRSSVHNPFLIHLELPVSEHWGRVDINLQNVPAVS